ncbi:MAG: MFS transporter [Spirochaetota bacterium]
MRYPFFYGWLILSLSTLGLLFSLPGQTNGVSAFTDPLLSATGLSRAELSFAYLIGTLASSLLLSAGGRLYDRLGPRILGSLVSGILGIILILASQSYRLLALFPGRPIIPFILFTLIFFALRFLGQGLLTLTSRNMVMQWFTVNRGRANAIMGLCMAFGFALAPRFFHTLIQHWEWNGAWLFLGCLELLFMGLFWSFGRKAPARPAQMRISKGKPKPCEGRDFTLKEAQQTSSFWVFSLSLSLQSLFITAQTFHISSIFHHAGLGREQAFSIFFPAAILATTVNFFASWLSDRIALRNILAFQAAGLALSSLSQSLLSYNFSLAFWGIVIGNGICGGLFNLINTVTWPRFYGTKHLGAISGRGMAFLVGGSALGPYLFSLNLKLSGSYSQTVLSIALLAAILVLISLRLPVLPERKISRQTAVPP